MTTYAFILGRKPLLSTAEICNVLDANDHIIDVQRENIVVSLDNQLENPQESINRLGGIIKIVEIFDEISLNKNFYDPVSKYLINKFKNHDSKNLYGLSLYNFSHNHEKILKNTLISLKKDFKKNQIKSRFINKDYKNLNTAAIHREKLIQKGSEIVIIQGTHKIFIGETKTIQDIDNYSKRDFDRPARNARLGMLPPKLAQIMINYCGYTKLNSSLNEDKTLYDPFAGMGTVLTEGLLLNYSVVGSDISDEVLEGAKKNIDWIKSTYNTQKQARLFQKDATSLHNNDLKEEIDLIATESYLGPPLSQIPDDKQISKTFSHIEETLTRFFRAIHSIIKPGTPIVISFAMYKDKTRKVTMKNLPEEIEKIGYKIEPLIPKDLANKFNLTVSNSSIHYDRPDQTVGREIWKFIRL